VLPKWLYPLLILFVVFFILSNPENAGPQARSFFGWIGQQASAAGTFLDGLFEGDGDEGGQNPTPTTFNDTNPGSDAFNTLGPLGSGGV
jgi:hypothetical protein